MSAPASVRTRDGITWTLRTVTSSGIALYAPKGVCECPDFVMATLAELAEHGIQSAELAAAVAEHGAFPVPVGSVPQAPPLSGPVCTQAEARAAGLDVAPSVEELDGMAESVVALGDPLSVEVSLAQAVPLLGAAVTGLRAQVVALLAERHSTNESVSDAAEALRAQRDRIAELETGIAWRDAERERWADVHATVERAIDKGWSGVDTCTLAAELGPEVTHVLAEPVAEPSCPCPPADQPGPHQVGCFFDGVPVSPPSERPVNELTATFAPVAALREVLDGEHFATVHHDYRVGHDLPEGCRLSEEQVRELGNPFLGGGA